jgi:hypothetical protein
MTDDNGAKAKFVDAARTEIERHWQASGSALLLSSLGTTLSQPSGELAAVLQGQKLRTFIESNQIGQIVQHPVVRQKIGVVPSSITVPTNPADLFERSAPQRRPRVDRVFWKAFYEPMLPGQRRFVVLGNREGMPLEIVNSAAPPEGTVKYHEILESDLVGSERKEEHDYINEMWANIDGWLKRNQLNVGSFVSSGSDIPRTTFIVGAGASLGAALSALDPNDLARIFVPLDIVGKMLSRK